MAIRQERVTGRWSLMIEDQILDEDHYLDEVPLEGIVTFSPVLPKGMSGARASEPSRLISFRPVRAMVAAGELVSLSGTVSEIGDVPGGPGQDLPAEVDGTTIWWRAVFDLKYNDTPVKLPELLIDLSDGPVDMSQMVSASGWPDVDLSEVDAIIASVKSMSRAAEDAIRRAEEAASAVGDVSDEAKAAVKTAGESAASAKEDAAQAAKSAAVVGDAQAVLDARDVATSAAGEASESAHDAAESAADASSSASAASSSAEAAASSAGESAESASAAASSASDAGTAKDDAETAQGKAEAAQGKAEESADAAASDRSAASKARDAAQSAQSAAEDARDAAAESAGSAASDAERAEKAADEADGEAVRAVTEKVDELTRDAPEKFDTLKEIADALEAQEDMGSALTSQIAGKADKEHEHSASDITGLDEAMSGKADQSWVEDHLPPVKILPVETLPPGSEQDPGTLYIQFGGA